MDDDLHISERPVLRRQCLAISNSSGIATHVTADWLQYVMHQQPEEHWSAKQMINLHLQKLKEEGRVQAQVRKTSLSLRDTPLLTVFDPRTRTFPREPWAWRYGVHEDHTKKEKGASASDCLPPDVCRRTRRTDLAALCSP